VAPIAGLIRMFSGSITALGPKQTTLKIHGRGVNSHAYCKHFAKMVLYIFCTAVIKLIVVESFVLVLNPPIYQKGVLVKDAT
jgi:hypothetical protein